MKTEHVDESGGATNETFICKKCGESVLINDGCEASNYCDLCAQGLVIDMQAALEKIANHHGLGENNCAMKPREMVEFMQETAMKAISIE